MAPVRLSPLNAWVITGYDDASALLRNPTISSEGHTRAFETFFRDEIDDLRKTLIFSDPPYHTRIRALVSKAFTVRGVDEYRPRIQEIADDLLDKVAAQGRMDLMQDYSYPLPTTFICEWLGVPPEDHGQFDVWMRQRAERFNVQPGLMLWQRDRRRRGTEAITRFGDYMDGLIAQRRREPADDFLSALIAVQEQDDVLTTDEISALASTLLIGGHETVANLTANTLVGLLHQPDQLAQLRDHSELTKSAVEEALRYDTPAQIVARTTTEPVQLGTTTIPAGEMVIILVGAANHDPRKFDDPDRIDITRKPNPHLSFIAGPHYCIGAGLARLELETALTTLLRRLPDLALDPTQPLEWRDTVALRGLKALPLTFTPQPVPVPIRT